MVDVSLLRMLQLASPSMPVGSFSYSQALERAVEQGIVCDRKSAARWLHDQLALNLARNDAPLFCRLFAAVNANDASNFEHWNRYCLTTRETQELRAEALNMGAALRRILPDAGIVDATALALLHARDEICYAAAFACAAASAGMSAAAALRAYLWAWLEGQMLAAVKLVPLGQSAGQSLLNELIPVLEEAAAAAPELGDEDLANFAPGFAIASAQHETQYSRLFRS